MVVFKPNGKYYSTAYPNNELRKLLQEKMKKNLEELKKQKKENQEQEKNEMKEIKTGEELENKNIIDSKDKISFPISLLVNIIFQRLNWGN